MSSLNQQNNDKQYIHWVIDQNTEITTLNESLKKNQQEVHRVTLTFSHGCDKNNNDDNDDDENEDENDDEKNNKNHPIIDFAMILSSIKVRELELNIFPSEGGEILHDFCSAFSPNEYLKVCSVKTDAMTSQTASYISRVTGKACGLESLSLSWMGDAHLDLILATNNDDVAVGHHLSSSSLKRLVLEDVVLTVESVESLSCLIGKNKLSEMSFDGCQTISGQSSSPYVAPRILVDALSSSKSVRSLTLRKTKHADPGRRRFYESVARNINRMQSVRKLIMAGPAPMPHQQGDPNEEGLLGFGKVEELILYGPFVDFTHFGYIQMLRDNDTIKNLTIEKAPFNLNGYAGGIFTKLAYETYAKGFASMSTLENLTIGGVGNIFVEVLASNGGSPRRRDSGNKLLIRMKNLKSLRLLDDSESLTDLRPLVCLANQTLSLCEVMVDGHSLRQRLDDVVEKDDVEIPSLRNQIYQLNSRLYRKRFEAFGSKLLLGHEPAALWPRVVSRLGTKISPDVAFALLRERVEVMYR